MFSESLINEPIILLTLGIRSASSATPARPLRKQFPRGNPLAIPPYLDINLSYDNDFV